MCNEYEAPTREQLDLFAEELDLPDPFDYLREPYPPRVFPRYRAPIIFGRDAPVVRLARWGMLGHDGRPVLVGPNKRPAATNNARTEEITKRPTFRGAWKNLQTCIIPAQAFYEPCYLNDKDEPQEKSFPMRMSSRDGRPLAIAGLYERHLQPDAEAPISYTMLMMSGEGHPIMRRMHRPEDEKRTAVLLEPDDMLHWLHVRNEADMRSFLRQFDADGIIAEPQAPRRKADKEKSDPDKPPTAQDKPELPF